MNYDEALRLLKAHGQEHLLEYFGNLSKDEQIALLKDIEKIDFTIINNIGGGKKREIGKITPISAISLEEIARRKPQFEEVGLNLLKRGKVGAVLLAGGQGSRLGFDKPKGMFNIGVTRKLSIFEQQMSNIFEVTKKTGVPFTLFIMTSNVTDADTRKFFEENNFFGYPRDCVHFFVQNLSPACDEDGKIYLKSKSEVLLLPNGNGGWYSSLISSGLDEVIKRENIEWLNVYGVDNVLQRVCDPVFIGATVLMNCNCGAKAVKKVDADEKVGVLCNEDGKPTVIEYYEMPENLKSQTTDGELTYRYGVILNYLFNVRALNATLSGKLPYHAAFKAIEHFEKGKNVIPAKPCGYKFETLAVDIVKMMGSCLAFEVDRKREFAPVKNATGADSVETARDLLRENGITL